MRKTDTFWEAHYVVEEIYIIIDEDTGKIE